LVLDNLAILLAVFITSLVDIIGQLNSGEEGRLDQWWHIGMSGGGIVNFINFIISQLI
jgi:hypothetical protein